MNNLAMAEMYVPYNNGPYFHDMQMPFGLAKAIPSYLPTLGAVSSKIEDEFVISEVVGEGVRWMDNQVPGNPIRRGQALKLWATLVAQNYSYIMLYTFADDGRISVQVGGTAQNYFGLEDATMHDDMNRGTHGHMGAWRMEFDLGKASTNQVEVVERLVDATTKAGRLNHRPFNNNKEGGEVWDPDRFTVLKITNPSTLNRHNTPQPVSYMLSSTMRGRLRTNDKMTERDFWVSRLVPDDATRRGKAPELKFIDVADNIARPEPIDNRAVVIWHNAALQHMSHGEDYGSTGYEPNDGSAIVSYVGFDLIPVGLWHKTPFLDRTPDRPATNTDSTPANPTPNPGTPPGQGGGSSSAVALTETTRRGDNNEQVRELQRRLLARGYQVSTDGNFGRGTEAAVRAFQRANNLPEDGVAGRRTRELLTS